MKNFILAAVVLVGVVFCLAASAQELSNLTVKSIDVSGLERVNEQLVRSKLEVQTGQTYNPAAVARDIRRLYDLGLFDSIKVDATPSAGGVALTYVFSEKRIIDEIKVIGNSKIRNSKVLGVLTWKKGDSFSPDAYDEERKAILKLYESKGYANTSVDINVEKVGPSRVRVTYVINEGKKARIRSIQFAGNQALSSHKLHKVMKTKRAHWFLGGKYNEDKLETDLAKITDEYGNHGYLEAKVTGTNINYSKNGKKMDITISIAEGAQYRVAALQPADNRVYDTDEIMGIVKVHVGDIHNKGQVTKDGELIAKGYQDSGYVNAEVTPEVTLNREDKTTNIIYKVNEGDLKYVRQITVTGNSLTKDEVVRREMLTEPGERFDGSSVKASQRRLENTHYFDKVRLTLHDVEDDNLYTDMLWDVDEGRPGNFNFGAGYSSEEKVSGFTELRLNNFDISNWPSFKGGGQEFDARLQLGMVHSRYNLSFKEPELFGYPLGLKVDAFDDSYKYTHSTSGSNYTENQAGGQITLGKALSEYVTVQSGISVTDVSYSNLALKWLYTEEWQRELSSSTTIANTWNIERRTLDYYNDPTMGSKHDLTAVIAGFGGDNDFIKFEHDSSWYFPLDERKKWILSFRDREGWMTEYGQSEYVPLAYRFFAGGTTTVRGYRDRDIGPREPRFWLPFSDKEPIGGKFRLVDNLEMKYKVTDILRLYGFVDSGGVWKEPGDLDFADFRFGAGVGLGVDVPRLGPVRVDVGYPLNPDSHQPSSVRLHMRTGFSF